MTNSLRDRRTAGFSLIEMLIVVSLISAITLFAFPRAGMIRDRSQVGGARTALMNEFNAARVAARSGNRTTVFRLANNVFFVERRPFTGTVKETVGSPVSMQIEHGVTASGPDSIVIDPRGMVSYYSSGTSATYLVRRGSIVDSVVINSYGRVLR